MLWMAPITGIAKCHIVVSVVERSRISLWLDRDQAAAPVFGPVSVPYPTFSAIRSAMPSTPEQIRPGSVCNVLTRSSPLQRPQEIGVGVEVPAVHSPNLSIRIKYTV